MEETNYQRDDRSDVDHGHQSHASNIENQGQQYATHSEGAEYSAAMEHQMQQNSPASNGTYTTSTSVQANNSLHSISSGGSAAEMARYFPNAQTFNSLSLGLQQPAEGQTQFTTASNTAVTNNLNTANAGPYTPAPASYAVPPLVRPPNTHPMAQQPAGQPQRLQGIPSYSSHIEGLSVSQAVVNDVLVDLQTKVLNETFQQHQDETSNESYLEHLPPIYIHAPQPTVILQPDLNRLRAELNSRARPPVVHRHSANANQFQQNQFHQNMFQAPGFPTPPQQFNPQEYYNQYRNPVYGSR